MALIDSTYFINDINLPTSVNIDFTAYIEKYEPEIIKRLVGYDLWKLIDAASVEQRIVDLVQGVEYTETIGNQTYTVKWNGLVNTEKISIIAYYVYCNIMIDRVSLSMPVGEVSAYQENSNVALIGQKVQVAWRRMTELYGYASQDLLVPSAYNFLYKHLEDYPELVFTDIGSLNALDL